MSQRKALVCDTAVYSRSGRVIPVSGKDIRGLYMCWWKRANHPATLRRPNPWVTCLWYWCAMVSVVDLSMVRAPMVNVYSCDGIGLTGLCLCIGRTREVYFLVKVVQMVSAQ